MSKKLDDTEKPNVGTFHSVGANPLDADGEI